MDRSRNTTTGGVSNRTFEDYDPAVEWSHAADADTATISLPGFRKEDVRVQVDSKGHLLVRGERPVEPGSSKWVRFSKDLKLPDNCDTGGIRVAKLENSKLTITFPKKNRPWAGPGSYALAPPPAAQQEEEGKGRPSPSGGSAPEPAPAVQEEVKKSHPSPPEDSASEPAPAVQEQEQEQKQEKTRPSHPDGSAPEPAPPPTQEEKNSLPSPPDGYASEPALAVQEEDDDEERTTMVKIESAGGRRPIHWLLVAVAALSFLGITAYVVWRNLRSICSAAGAGDHGPGELAGAGTFIDEM